jgi:hypothetical protein
MGIYMLFNCSYNVRLARINLPRCFCSVDILIPLLGLPGARDQAR